MFGKAAAYLKGGHWNTDASALPAAKRIPLRLFRFVTMAWGAFAGHRGKLHAAALTYFTLTTVVPVLCLVLLAAKYLGLGEFARKHINEQIEQGIESFEADARATAEYQLAQSGAALEAAKAAAGGKEPAAGGNDQPAGGKPAAGAAPAAGVKPAAAEAPAAEATAAAPGTEAAPAADDASAKAASEAEAKRAEALAKREEALAKLKVAQEFAARLRDFSNKIFDQIRDFDIGTLGVAGLALLLWTVICTLGSVEESFNDVWDVAKPRSLLKRVWYYTLVIAILPLLVCASSAVPLVRALSGTILSYIEYIPYAEYVTGVVYAVIESPVAGAAITLCASACSFAFFLWAMPNAKIGFRAALKSGFITCVMFAGWLKLCAVAQVGISKSSAIYGSFSLLPIVLAWVYVSWEIVLLGAAVSRVFRHGTDSPLSTRPAA